MQVLLQQTLKKQNRSLFWLSEQTGIAYSTLHKFANGKTSKVSFDVIDQICTTLDCEISDIMIADNKKDQ